ncbi:trehalose-phosphatase [Isoptericola sp. NPDC019693]|uniref:trehalose-phosphatase n=1 Tax=Isoptericola sp. NPDC019693 TaxID=3364009 RepID=UPI003799E177
MNEDLQEGRAGTADDAPAVAAVMAFARPADGPPSRTARVVALDFDGTLAPLVDDPAASRMTPAARAAVERLADLAARPVPPGGDELRLALVSGRNLTDLAARSGVPAGTYLVGSHGAETGRVGAHGVDAVPLRLTDAQADALERLREGLQDAIDGRRGAWVQDKPSAAVLHTRRCGPDDARAAAADADAVAARLGLHAMHGKDVVEIAVLPTSKGVALDRLREELEEGDEHLRTRVLYAGDDTTDETAFEVLRAGDLGVKVGPGRTLASERVDDADALAALLDRLADALEG